MDGHYWVCLQRAHIMPSATASDDIEYLGIHLMEDGQDLYNEKYNTLLRKTKDLKQDRDVVWSWIGSQTL